jgi:hypothetical protein
MQMTPSEFLASFDDVHDSQLHTLRFSDRVAQWTEAPEFYLDLAKQMIPGDPDAWPERQRLISILREMLYTDGRSLAALLYVAETAASNSEYSGSGISALAGIYCFLYSHGAGDYADLLDTFERLAQTPALTNNALRCAQLVSNAS